LTYQTLEKTTTPSIHSFDDFVTEAEKSKLIDFFCSPSFRWGLTVNAVNGVKYNIEIKDDAIVGLFHSFVFDWNIRSEYYEEVSWLLDRYRDYGFDPEDCFRMRAGMFLKHPSQDPHEPHVDATFPHYTSVFYINDCDGDFHLYNETYKTHPFKKPTKFTLVDKIAPKSGSVIMFNGEHYHASSYPNRSSLRLAITFNFIKKEDQ